MTQMLGQTWQDVNEAALAAIGSASRETMEAVMARVDKHLDAPLRMGQTQPTANAILNFQPNQVELGDGKKKTTPPVEGAIDSYAGATIDFQTGAITGGTLQRNGAAFTLPGGYTTGHFVLVVFVYNGPNNAINSSFSSGAATIGALPNPGSLFSSVEGTPIGYVYLEATAASAFKTAGSVASVIENKVGATPRIFIFGGGTGSGASGGEGDTSFTAKLLQSNILTLKKGFLMLDYQVELVTYDGVADNTDIAVNLKTEVNTAGVTSPAAATPYYLYIDLFSLGSEVSYGTTDRKAYRVQKGTSGNLMVLASKPSETNPRRFVPLAALKTDGSSDYAAFADLAHRRHDTVASFIYEPQKKTYQLTTAVASDVTAHGLAGEPQILNLYYYDGTKKIGLNSSSHLLNKTSANIEVSTLGLTFGGGQYVEVEAFFVPTLSGSVVSPSHDFQSSWFANTATTTVAHTLNDMEAIRGYEVQEWDLTAGKIRNIDRSALVVNFDNSNFYLDWTGLAPSVSLKYRVVAGGTPIPASTPVEYGGYNKFVGAGPGHYPTLTAALASAAPGDSILVHKGYTISAAETISLSDISIFFRPGAEITITGGTQGLLITGNRVYIDRPKYKVNFAGTLNQVVQIDGNDCDIQCASVVVDNAGVTVTDVYKISAAASRNYLRSSVNTVSGTVTNKLNDLGTDTDATVRG